VQSQQRQQQQQQESTQESTPGSRSQAAAAAEELPSSVLISEIRSLAVVAAASGPYHQHFSLAAGAAVALPTAAS
jgi:protein required for attachment to host cells